MALVSHTFPSCCELAMIFFSKKEICSPCEILCGVQINTLPLTCSRGAVMWPSAEDCDWTGTLTILSAPNCERVAKQCWAKPAMEEWILAKKNICNFVITCRLWLRLAQCLQQQQQQQLNLPRPQLRTSVNPEAQKSLRAIWQPNKQKLVQAISTTSIALHHCHGYWSITTVSWELNKHSRHHVMQIEKGKKTKQTDTSASEGAFVTFCHQVFRATGLLGHFTNKSGLHYITRIIN